MAAEAETESHLPGHERLNSVLGAVVEDAAEGALTRQSGAVRWLIDQKPSYSSLRRCLPKT